MLHGTAEPVSEFSDACLPIFLPAALDSDAHPARLPIARIQDTQRRLCATYRGPVYVIIHECDVARQNSKHFNQSVLICPIIRFKRFIELYLEFNVRKGGREFLQNLATRKIYKLFYFPAYDSRLP